MDKKYFPHATDGSLNPDYTYATPFNFQPTSAITIDSRSIITEWSDAALKTIKSSEVYVGLQIYSLSDKILKVCTWVPTEVGTTYSGYNCLWDNAYVENKQTVWLNVSTYVPEISMEEKKVNAENTKWKFALKQNYGYWGFYDYKSTNPTEIKDKLLTELNDVVKQLVIGATKQSVLSGQILSFKADVTVKAAANKMPESYTEAKNKLLTIIIPKSTKKQIKQAIFLTTPMQKDDLYINSHELQYINKSTFEFEKVIYDFYVFTLSKMETTSNLTFYLQFEDEK